MELMLNSSLSNGNEEDFAKLMSRSCSSFILWNILSWHRRDASLCTNGFVIWSMHSRSCAGDRFVEHRSNDDDGGILNASTAVDNSRDVTVKVTEISTNVIMAMSFSCLSSVSLLVRDIPAMKNIFILSSLDQVRFAFRDRCGYHSTNNKIVLATIQKHV